MYVYVCVCVCVCVCVWFHSCVCSCAWCLGLYSWYSINVTLTRGFYCEPNIYFLSNHLLFCEYQLQFFDLECFELTLG